MSDDFFSRDDDNDGRAPPKVAGSLAASTVVRQRKGPPPPPPRRPAATASATTTAATSTPTTGTTASVAAPRPRPTPSRPSPAATSAAASTANPATASTTSASTTRPRPTPRATTAKAKPNTGNSPTGTGTSNPALPTARSSTRTAPAMSRPVGQYYAADTPSYSKPHAEETSLEDTWDWGAQTPAPAPAPTPQSWAAPNPHSWAAPATDSTAASSNSGDWYATDTQSQTNANGMYSFNSSGFYGATVPQPTEPKQEASFFSGRMDDAPVTPVPTVFQPKPFVPQAQSTQSSSNFMTGEEAPLLEELGINLEHIGMKTKAVILPFSRFGGLSMEPADIVKDADLAGPIAFCLILGAQMVLTGKLQFGYIYGFGVFGCASMTLIVNLMSPLAEGISIWTVSSVLGYALIPVNLLAAVKLIVINLGNLQSFGRFLGLLTVAWSTIASTRLLELGFGLREQRYLIAYPVALLYSAFVMITIF